LSAGILQILIRFAYKIFYAQLYTKTGQQEGDNFLEACREGSMEKAIHFINSGVDVNYRNEVCVK